MNKKILAFAVAFVAVALLALPISAAYATESVTVNGTRRLTSFVLIDSRVAGKSDNVIAYADVTHTWEGDIVGIATGVAHRITHIMTDGTRMLNIHVEETFSSPVTVMGQDKSGTLTIRLEYNAEAGVFDGTWVIIGGTGDLANLHGQGTLSGLSTAPVPYSGQVHFDP